MTRTDADSWDVASSVGATATMVAAARAIAGREPNAIIDDPDAEPLVRAVGLDFFTGGRWRPGAGRRCSRRTAARGPTTKTLRRCVIHWPSPLPGNRGH